MVAINTVFLLKTFGKVRGKRLRIFRWCIKPLIASVVMGFGAYWSQIGLDVFLPERIATVLSVFIAVIVYALVLLVVRGVKKRDLEMLPGGTRISGVLTRLHLLKG